MRRLLASQPPVRIALIAPLVSPIAPPFAGGAQAVVHDLAAALAAGGETVTLFAAEGSLPPRGVALQTLAIDPMPEASIDFADPQPEASRAMELAFGRIAEAVAPSRFDVVHAHAFDAPAFATLGPRAFHTLHLPPIKADVVQGAGRAARAGARLACVSRAAERAWARLSPISAVLPNGIEVGRVPFGASGSGQLLFAGRMSPEKGVEDAVAIARAARRRLRVAGGIYDPDYFAKLRPALESEGVEYLGPLAPDALYREMAAADALLFPVRWDEPFGLVMLEAMAAGTPVVAYARGAVPEIVQDGVTGFIVPPGDRTAAVRALEHLPELSRPACRQHVAAHFGLEATVARHRAWYRPLQMAAGL